LYLRRWEDNVNAIIVIVGICISAIALAVISVPGTLIELVKNLEVTTGLRVFASVVRILLGILMVYIADLTRFPLVIEWLGYLFILAGVGLLLVKNQLLQTMINWFLGFNLIAVRIAGVVALLFGGFLVLAAI
jgi:hypothetical protein